MTTRIKLRRDTAANWTANNPILALGEAGIETDNNNIKYGDGITPWNDLDYPAPIKAREQKGFITEVGLQPSYYPYDDQWLASVAVDDAGNSYYVGGFEEYTGDWWYRNMVVKLNPLGGLEWQRRITVTEGDEGYGTSVTIDPTNGQIVTVNEFWTTAVGGNHPVYTPTIVRLDPETGDIVGYPTFIADGLNIYDNTPGGGNYGNIYIGDITLDNNGNTIIVGTKYGDQKEIPVTPLLGSTGSVLIVSSSTFSTAEYPRYTGYDYAWFISGTDLSNKNYINAVNRFNNISGTVNVESTGSGATFNFYYNNKTAQVRSNSYGINYQPGDVITIPADQINGLTSATITVNQVDEYGAILYRDFYYDQTNWSYTYEPDKSKVYLYVDDGDVAFENSGSWTIIHNYNSNAFVWSPDGDTPWNLSIGDSSYDQFDTVAVDSNNYIIAGGKGWTDTSTDGYEGQPEYYGSVVKISQDGEQIWAKSLEIVDGGEGWEVTGLIVDSNDDIIVVQDSFGSGLVTKLNNDGEKIWRKSFTTDPASFNDSSVAVDEDDNIYVVSRLSSAYSLGDDLQILKIASDGHLIWQRSLGTWADEQISWWAPSKTLTVKNGMIYIAGTTQGANNHIGNAIALPTDGTGLGNYQSNNWIYKETNWDSWSEYTANSTITNLVISSTATSLVVTTSTDYQSTDSEWTVVTTPILHGFGGEIVGVKSLTFEDGSIQTSAAGTMTRSSEGRVQYEDSLDLRLEHSGQFIVFNNSDDGYNQYCDVYIPHNNDVAFPIGTEITFVKDENTDLVYFWPQNGNNEIYIVPCGLDPSEDYYNNGVFDGGEGWAVVGNPINGGGGAWRTPGIAKLLKIDVNRWMLSITLGLNIIQY